MHFGMSNGNTSLSLPANVFFTRWDFRELIAKRVADYLQPDLHTPRHSELRQNCRHGGM